MRDDNRRPDAGGEDAGGRNPGQRDPGDDTVAGTPLDETVAGGPPDETRAHRPAIDETRALPRDDVPGGADRQTVEGPAATGGPAPVWSGRAEVPPAGVRAPGPATEQWARPPGEDGGRWWMPIVLGLVGLALLGVLGYGLWLIGAADDDGSEPGPTPPRPATVAPRTTAAPTTAPPTPEQEVEVPRLVGESLEDAQARLDERGLTYRVEFEQTDSFQPGTVIRTRPRGGSDVEPGSQVTIVVAAEPEETEPPTPPPSDEESPPGE
jgi:hypothetical protein